MGRLREGVKIPFSWCLGFRDERQTFRGIPETIQEGAGERVGDSVPEMCLLQGAPKTFCNGL